MTYEDWTWLGEALLAREEVTLLNALKLDPRDSTRRSIYADWLEEYGRIESAALVRQGYTPGASRVYLHKGSGSVVDHWEYYPQMIGGSSPPRFTSGPLSGDIISGMLGVYTVSGDLDSFVSFIASGLYPLTP